MDINLLESERVDRYVLEVFVGKLNLAKTCNAQALNNNANMKDKSKKNEEPNSKPKYTIKIMLDGVLDTEISSYDKVVKKDEDQREDGCSAYYNDLETRESIINIRDRIAEQYIMEQKPILNAYTVCYNITNKDIDYRYISVQPSINKGVICIFACVPRTLITILQRNTFELLVCEDLNDDELVFGIVSQSLSGAIGFTDAIAYHFYEKGYCTHSHTSEKTLDVKNMDNTQTIGDMAVRLKLTCHGPEKMEVNQIRLKPDNRPKQLKPIFIDENAFDFPFDKRVLNFPPKMMYDDVNRWRNEIEVYNPDIKELLDCQSVQYYTKNKPCTCPCTVLLENVKQILFNDEKQSHSECESVNKAKQFCCQDWISKQTSNNPSSCKLKKKITIVASGRGNT